MSGPLPRVLAPLSSPLAWAYRAAIRRRNLRFDRGDGIRQLDRPVLSVGNITVGGTGKTPMVMWIVRALRDAGHRPLIAMRGYGAPAGAHRLPDEQAEYLERLPDVPIVAGPDRFAALSDYLRDHDSVDCIVLDDGFQHRRLARDLDLVLIDATRDTMHDHLLPRGWLREPLENLARADAVIVTRADSLDHDLARSIERYHGRAPIAWTRHRWTHLDLYGGREDGRAEPEAVAWLDGKRVLTLLGVGNPAAVRRQIESMGATVSANIPAADHEAYDRQKLLTARGLCSSVDAMITTAKDWMKIRELINLGDWPCPIVVPRVEIEFIAGEGPIKQRILNTVRRVR
jgi:tetraacyldisaccharide 4'-kinase